MADDPGRWKKYSKLKFDSKKVAERAKRAEQATLGHAHEFILKRWSSIHGARRSIITWIVLVAVLIGAVGLQIAWFSQQYRTGAAAPGGTYAEATLGPIDTLNPLYASSSAERSAARLLFSSLYSYDSHGGIRGDLAESMSLEEDSTVYFVKLRQGLSWHDGRPLTARDVVFTVNLIKDPDTRSYLSPVWQGIDTEAIDDTTVKFSLPATIAAFPHALTFPVVPRHILADVPASNLRENSFSNSPVGSGPFQFRRLQSVSPETNTSIVHMNRFDNHHGGAPQLGRFQLHAYSDREAIMTALKTGEVNGAVDILASDLVDVDPTRYEADNLPMYGGVYALFNTDRPALEDRKVRQALRLAVDTSAVRRNLGMANKALDLPFLPDQVDVELPSTPEHNRSDAAKLLDSAGWKLDDDRRVNKDGEPLKLDVVTVKNSEYEAAVESLAGQWRAIGIQVETLVVDPSVAGQDVAQSVLQPRAYDVLVYELAIGADPDVYAYWHSSQATPNGRNLSNYTNAVADDALSSARARVETELRGAKYASFARLWVQDAPAVGLYQSSFAYAHSVRAETVMHDSVLVTPQARYADVVDWTVDQQTVYKTP